MITILGAGGAIGNELVKLLAANNQPFRLVGRNLRATLGATETVAADLTDKDQTIRAVAGSKVVHRSLVSSTIAAFGAKCGHVS